MINRQRAELNANIEDIIAIENALEEIEGLMVYDCEGVENKHW